MKKILNLFRYLIGAFLIFGGVSDIKNSLFFGISTILLGIIFLPVVTKKVPEMKNRNMKIVLSGIILFVIMIISIPENDEYSNISADNKMIDYNEEKDSKIKSEEKKDVSPDKKNISENNSKKDKEEKSFKDKIKDLAGDVKDLKDKTISNIENIAGKSINALENTANKLDVLKSNIGDIFNNYAKDGVCDSTVNSDKIYSKPNFIEIGNKTYDFRTLTTTELHNTGLKFNESAFNALYCADKKIGLSYYNKNKLHTICGEDKSIKFYKKIYAGMSKANIIKNLGKPSENDDESYIWYYNSKGKKISDKDNAAYGIMVEFDESDISLSVQLDCIKDINDDSVNYFVIEAEQGFFKKQKVKVYIDNIFVYKLDKNNPVKCILFPRIKKEHTLKVGSEKIRFNNSNHNYVEFMYSLDHELIESSEVDMNMDDYSQYIIVNEDGGVLDCSDASDLDVCNAMFDFYN